MEPLSRPPAPRSSSERARAWIEWFGVGRLLGAAIATLIVCAGAYWLVRMPPPATEASLPRAGGSASTSDDSWSAASPSSPSSSTVAVDATVVVHVAGAVAEPGVYELTATARVGDAVAVAGGPAADADLDALNLAAFVTDAGRVYVPMVGETVPSVSSDGSAAVGAGPPVGSVDVNDADAALLDTLPGVGPAIAAAIVTERDRNGPFLGVDDLERVPGIGPAKLAAIRDLVTT